MLKKIELRNFKNHKATEINLDSSRLHAFVGSNGSGKTSVLQAIHYLSQLSSRQFKEIFGYERDPGFLVRSNADNLCVSVEGDSSSDEWSAHYGFSKTHSSKYRCSTSWCLGGSQSDTPKKPNEQNWNGSLINAPFAVNQALKHAVFLKLEASNLSKPSYSSHESPRLEFNGEGLASALDGLSKDNYADFLKIQEMLKSVVPSIKSIRLKRAKVIESKPKLISIDGQNISYQEKEERMGEEIFVDTLTGNDLPAHLLSEGTLLTLGLLTVFMGPNKPNLILLDDIDQALHPKAQFELVNLFKEVIKNNKKLQIIFSTHSPYILDALRTSQVHVFSNDRDGFSKVKRLDQHPDIEWAEKTLTTGEIWDAEGEDWVLIGE